MQSNRHWTLLQINSSTMDTTTTTIKRYSRDTDIRVSLTALWSIVVSGGGGGSSSSSSRSRSEAHFFQTGQGNCINGAQASGLVFSSSSTHFALVSVFQWPVFVVCCQCALSDHQPIIRFFILKAATLLQLLVVLSNILS